MTTVIRWQNIPTDRGVTFRKILATFDLVYELQVLTNLARSYRLSIKCQNSQVSLSDILTQIANHYLQVRYYKAITSIPQI